MLREHITFQVEGQVFALDIMAIREIRAWTPATRLPRVPAYVAGVVNLRGTVLPVMDLAARLGWKPVEGTPRHAIIVTQIGNRQTGLIVESVSDIVTIDDASLQAPPATADSSVLPFLTGLAALDDQMVMVLDLGALAEGEALPEAA